jgi:Domain of unknown function (DUF6457)
MSAMADDTNQRSGSLSGTQWVAQFAAALGLDAPDEATTNTLLDLAGAAAHASERTAAPIACYLVGRAGLSADEALAVASRIGEGG